MRSLARASGTVRNHCRTTLNGTNIAFRAGMAACIRWEIEAWRW
jgi:hypothetical protein